MININELGEYLSALIRAKSWKKQLEVVGRMKAQLLLTLPKGSLDSTFSESKNKIEMINVDELKIYIPALIQAESGEKQLQIVKEIKAQLLLFYSKAKKVRRTPPKKRRQLRKKSKLEPSPPPLLPVLPITQAPVSPARGNTFTPYFFSSISESEDECKEIFSLFEAPLFDEKKVNELGEKLLRFYPPQLYGLFLKCQKKYPARYRELMEKVDRGIMLELIGLWIKGLNEGKSSREGKFATIQAVLNDETLVKTIIEENSGSQSHSTPQQSRKINMSNLLKELSFFSAEELQVILLPLLSFILNKRTSLAAFHWRQNTQILSNNLEHSINILEKMEGFLEKNDLLFLLIARLIQECLRFSLHDKALLFLARISNPKIVDCLIKKQDVTLPEIFSDTLLEAAKARQDSSGPLFPAFTRSQQENLKKYAEYYEQQASHQTITQPRVVFLQ